MSAEPPPAVVAPPLPAEPVVAAAEPPAAAPEAAAPAPSPPPPPAPAAAAAVAPPPPPAPAAPQPAPPQQPQANGIARKRKLLLRLDDGSLIGPVEALLGTASGHGAEAVLLDFESACRTGKAGKEELLRLDRLIEEFQRRTPGFMKIPHNQLKQRNPYVQDLQRQLKRQRSLAAGDLPSLPSDLQLAASAGAGGLGTPQQAPSFTPECASKCTDVLRRVYATCTTMQPIFGLHVKDVFYRPVTETFPVIAEDYYKAIAQPMTFAMIEQRIASRAYTNTQQFADDVRLVFNNCKQYNPMPADPVRLAALKLSEVFENIWVSSGLCAEAQRAKRATAGIAAPKYEPEEYDALPPLPSGRRTTSHQRSGEQGGGGGAGGAGVGGGGAGSGQQRERAPMDGHPPAAQNHEVSSYREEEVEQHSIPEDVLQDVATQLQELQPEQLQEALNRFNEGVVSLDEDGEVELDLEKVDRVSLFAVDTYIRGLQGLPPREPQQPQQQQQQPAAAAPPAAPSGLTSEQDPAGAGCAVRAEQDDDDDDYDDEESDDDD